MKREVSSRKILEDSVRDLLNMPLCAEREDIKNAITLCLLEIERANGYDDFLIAYFGLRESLRELLTHSEEEYK